MQSLEWLLSLLASIYLSGVVFCGAFNLWALASTKDEVYRALPTGTRIKLYVWVIAFLTATLGWPILLYDAFFNKRG
jgi:hypothetical protein